MKTPTLIVRLVGLYLIVSCSVNLIQIQKVQSFAGSIGFGVQQQSVVSNIQSYAIVGLLVGLVMGTFAGSLARLLTFDSGSSRDERA